MPAKKKAATKKKTTAPKAPKAAPKKVEEVVEKCNCAEKCDCKDKCTCATTRNSLPLYFLMAILVATLTVLVVSVGFNISVREMFNSETYVYNGKFDSDVNGDKKDENGFQILSAGGVIDMVKHDKAGFLIVGKENEITGDAFARRVKSMVEGEEGIYRYNMKAEEGTDEIRADKALGIIRDTPTLLYIRGGVVYDRIDDVKDLTDLSVFLQKYLPSEDAEN
jgi:hypothetical protein